MTTVSLAIIFALSASAALLGTRLVQQGLMAQRHRRTVGRRLDGFAGEPIYEPLGELGPFETAIRRMAQLSLSISKDLETQARLVRAAGIFANGAVYRFLALRIALSTIGLLAALIYSTTAGCSPIVAAALTAAVVPAGYGGPIYVLRYLAGRRRKRISRELPLFLDSVKLLIQTGASLELALRQITRIETAAIPELRRTLDDLLQDLDQGKSYELALERWAEKAAVPGATEFAGLALQSIKYGTELSPMLEQFISDLIEQRLAMARELAGKRSVSMTVVMVAFFLPPLMAIIGAPAVVDIVRNLLH
jgi:tight adherence protein C